MVQVVARKIFPEKLIKDYRVSKLELEESNNMFLVLGHP